MTKFQEVTSELARLADELATLPGQHEAELWGNFELKARELQELIGSVRTANVTEPIRMRSPRSVQGGDWPCYRPR